METSLKDQISEGARRYLAETGASQRQLARLCDVNPSYLSNILNRVYECRTGKDKKVEIKEKYFRAIAAVVGIKTVVSYWPHINTPQYMEAMEALLDARERQCAKMILGETGCGKTYAVNTFCSRYPSDTVRLTVMGDDHVKDLVEGMADQLGIKPPRRTNSTLRKVCRELRAISDKGRKLTVVIDEAENTKGAGIKAYKAIYDATNGFCGFVLVATPEIEKNLTRFERHGNMNGIPQFRRRFKANTVRLSPVEHTYADFLEQVSDPDLRHTLTALCDNYGELHDYLEPVLRETAERGIPLTDEFFRIKYKIG